MKLEDKDILNVGDLKRLIAEERKKQKLTKRGFLLETPEDLEEASSLRKEPHAFKAVFLFGPAGSGKTFISNQVGLPKVEDGDKGFSTVNPDQRIEDVFPSFGVTMKFASGEGNEDLEKLQQGMRGILQNASQRHTHNLITKAKPLIFDTTGEDVKKMMKRIKALQEVGYSVGVLMVNVPPDVSVDRDNNRARTVGADRTRDISDTYQQAVVQERGYFKALRGSGATVFGGDIYPNLFNLSTNTLLSGISPEHVKAMGNPTPEGAKALLDNIKKDVQMFLSADTPLPAHGEAIKAAMLKLIKITGKYGQNMLDVEMYWSDAFREEYPEVVGDKHIEQAAKYLSWLGGAEPAAKKANRSRKNTGDDTIRDMTGNRNPTKMGQVVPGTDTEDNPQGRNRRWQESEQKLVSDIIREAVLQIKKDLGE